MAPTKPQTLPVLQFENHEAFAKWMARHHAKAPGVWVKFAKAGSGIQSVSFPDALEEALCWGWIDGLRRGVDADWYVQKFTPRGKRSLWSKINCGKATALIDAGRMQAAGLAEVERAKQDGRWARAYDSPSRAQIPDDLAAALAKHPTAAKFFATLDSRNRYAILHRLMIATKPETRARRLEKFVEMLKGREKIYQ